jgi:hypothetical protein
MLHLHYFDICSSTILYFNIYPLTSLDFLADHIHAHSNGLYKAVTLLLL